MYMKLENGNYVDDGTGNSFDVKNLNNATDGSPTNWAVRFSVPMANRGIPYIVQSGYADAEDAQAALDELMLGESAVTIQPPVAPEEIPAEEVKE